MKCFTCAALRILNGDASLRILSTDASGCFFINVTFTALAKISIRGDFFFKSYHKFIEFNLFFIHLILLWIDELIHPHSIYISSMTIEFHLWYENYRRHFSNLSSMKVFEFQLQFHWSLFPRVQLIISQYWFGQWLGTEQVRNHYPNQCWPNSPTHIYGTRGK